MTQLKVQRLSRNLKDGLRLTWKRGDGRIFQEEKRIREKDLMIKKKKKGGGEGGRYTAEQKIRPVELRAKGGGNQCYGRWMCESQYRKS